MSRRLYGAHVGANGIRLHYLRFGGQGCPLVIVPGITSPAETWDFVGERLGEKNDVYIMDVRGRGLSSSGSGIEHGLQAYAADLEALVLGLGLDGCVLLGHSMGARIAARAVSRGALSLRGVVLAEPPVSGPGRRAYPKTLQSYLDAIEQARRGEISMEALRAAYPRWTEGQWRKRAEWLHTCDVDAVRSSYADFHETDFFEDLRNLSPPSLLMVAGQGGVILEADVQEIRNTVAALQVEWFAQCGHMLPFDDLEAFATCVEQFVLSTHHATPSR